jgi:signal transduction histidine kinase
LIVCVLENRRPDEACFGVCEEHGQQRAHLRTFTVTQILQEYQILRDVLFSFLEMKFKTIPNEVREIILAAIDEGVRTSSEKFVQVENEDQKKTLEEKLKETKKEVTSLHQERNQQTLYMGAAAHDIKTPLAVIKMAADLISDQIQETEINKEEILEYTQLIKEKIEQCLTTLHDVLDTMSADSGMTLSLDLQHTDLQQLLRDLVEEYAHLADERFLLECQTDPIVGTWDKLRIRRVFENILSNAVKYAKPRTPISIRVYSEDRFAKVEIHNFGSPIPKEIQNNLFKPFSRAPDAAKSGRPGWGIGLAFVRSTLDSHRGKINVKSDESGTTFTVCLPMT